MASNIFLGTNGGCRTINFIFTALCIYCSEDTVKDNRKIIKNLGIKEEEFIDYFKKDLKRKRLGYKNFKSVKKMRSYCEQLIRETIRNNTALGELIFAGRGNFEVPYFVDYIYKNGDLTPNVIPEKYSISNGSGKHKGTYTIIFKPM